MVSIHRTLLCAVAFVLLTVCCISCKKTSSTPTVVVTPTPSDTTITPPVEPALAKTMGFFLDDWKPKSFTKPTVTESAIAASAASTVTVDASAIITKIPLSTFGHNAVWWMGPVPAQATMDIKNLHPHIIRFPGGNSSNNYFWNAEQDKLPADVPVNQLDKDGKSVPAGYNYGKTDHNWEFNLEKYYALLQQTGNQGLIAVNYGYARYSTSPNPVAVAAHLAADWVRFDNGRTQYWEIGNEHYGNWQPGYRIDPATNKDGQPEIITGDLYGKHVQIFIDSMQKAATEIGKKIYIGAVAHESPSPESWQTPTTKTWNAGMMKSSGNKADFYVVHNYFTPSSNVNAAGVLSAAAKVPGDMMKFVTKELQDNGATLKPIAFDEWNMFALGAQQQVSNTSGVFALIVMGEVLKNQYGMAARWDFVNGWENGNDHGLFSAGDEPGGIEKWSPRPSFYYMYFLQKSLGDRLVSSTVKGSTNVLAYASTYTSGEMNVNLVNTSATAQTVEVKTANFRMGTRFYWYSLTGSNDNGEFSRKVLINGSGPTGVAGGPANYATLAANSASTTKGIKVTVPAFGAVCLVIDKK